MSDEKFYFNPSTGEVTQGKVGGWDDRMGPYDTREEAQRALDTAAERNKRAEAQDEADDNWGEPASWEK
ncbi:hypothetical protein KBP53_08160 [Corynebacterium genitalium ATCC 33030]|uniref:SPOR domain-containing protein n=1 Tax=Corynebacterium genitalium ATCC 33030 TaxID=585529 RepID=D7WEF6_9CORY|nr:MULTISPECIES: hypothetical protein [Corynebacterium]MCQ4618324.1 hypothetical protein [Corynebacterium pseudogenitalium]EFK53533.1 hypothetical protein HMPREF0291_11190 [Corynebacterium genitalium ATCC 33030]MCQ4621542.1 hypothetical protein [Corynebacterium sp. CCUG 71335]MCQ4622672.1 hypothetical protein [Corynebacterium sp. CCUG 70398]MCQ4624524.1 hypothetical protein [Corynebacterium sp. CCUG 69979]